MADLGGVMNDSRKTIYPNYFTKRALCTLLIFANLAEPDWIQISCSAKLLTQVICQRKTEDYVESKKIQEYFLKFYKFYQTVAQESFDNYCAFWHIFLNGTCYSFQWHGRMLRLRRMETTTSILPPKPHSPTAFLNLFTASSLPFLTFFYENKTNKVLKVTYRRQLNFTQVESHSIQGKYAKGIFVHVTRRIDISFGMNILELETQFFVSSYFFFCHLLGQQDKKKVKVHANFSSQYHNLTIKTEELLVFAGEICHGGVSFARIKNCLRTLLNSVPTNKWTVQIPTFTCNNNVKIDPFLVNDLVADCQQSEDEPVLLSQRVEMKMYKCKFPHQIPCRPGHIKCYNISEICSYKLNKNNHLIPCRTREHLQSCGTFFCNLMFKYASSYCISWAYVCDQKWDCPYGDDEIECAENCRNDSMF